MKLETFFEKFDQFADAPDAVAKMLVLGGQSGVTDGLGGRIGDAARRGPRHRREPPLRPRRRTHRYLIDYDAI